MVDIPKILGEAIAGYVSRHLLKAEVQDRTKELLGECLPGVVAAVARFCPDGSPMKADADGRVFLFVTDTAHMGMIVDGWPELGPIPPDIGEISNADLWAIIAEYIEKDQGKVSYTALSYRLGPAGIAKIDAECAELAQKGFTPAVIVIARRLPTNKAAGLCMTVPLPKRV